MARGSGGGRGGGIGARGSGGGMPASSAANAKTRGRRGPATSDTGITGRKIDASIVAADHVPAHTFANTTMPRQRSRYNPSVGPSDNDADDAPTRTRTTSMQSPTGDGVTVPPRQTNSKAYRTQEDVKRGPDAFHLSSSGPQRTRELAAAQKSSNKSKFPQIKPSKVGTFTAKAKAAGKTPLAYAAQVMANTKNYDTATVRQANFAKNFGGASKRRAKKGG